MGRLPSSGPLDASATLVQDINIAEPAIRHPPVFLSFNVLLEGDG